MDLGILFAIELPLLIALMVVIILYYASSLGSEPELFKDLLRKLAKLFWR